jgi:hypothetical protein
MTAFVPFGFVGGSGIFLAFIIVFFLAVVFGLYTRKGSGINQRGYNKIYQGSPGARGESKISGRSEADAPWMRKRRPPRKPEE